MGKGFVKRVLFVLLVAAGTVLVALCGLYLMCCEFLGVLNEELESGEILREHFPEAFPDSQEGPAEEDQERLPTPHEDLLSQQGKEF